MTAPLLSVLDLVNCQCVAGWLSVCDRPVVDKVIVKVLLCLGYGLILYIPVNSYRHVGTVSSPNHTFFLGKLD